jgi:hypothetical protein
MKKCAPPAPFFRQPAAPIDPDFQQQGCSHSAAAEQRRRAVVPVKNMSSKW